MGALDETYEVVVVGGGGSGLAAAVSSAEAGRRVVLLEKLPVLGGTTGIAVGSFTASNTRLQQARNIVDDPQDHAVDAGKFAPPTIEVHGNLKLREFFLKESAETLRWLESMGLRFHGPHPEPPNRCPRMHNVVPNAKAYIAVLQSRLLALGGDICCSAHVRKLFTTERGVAGVEVDLGSGVQRIHATKGVVLAAGDYANDPELIARFVGPEYAAIEGINIHATGEGQRFVESVGGKLRNMQIAYGPELRFVPPPREPFVRLLPTRGWPARFMARCLPWVPASLMARFIQRLLVTWQHPENALFEDGAILMNQRGERFCDETASPQRELAVARQPGKQAFILLDESLIRRYSKWPHFISTAPEIAYAYVQDYLKLRADVAVQGTSLAEISSRWDIPKTALSNCVAETNRERKKGSKSLLEGNQWLLLGPVKAYFTTTEGGADIDTNFRVLNIQGKPIPGLYAVGQNGLGGQILWGHGLHIAWAMTSGRLVGKAVSQPF